MYPWSYGGRVVDVEVDVDVEVEEVDVDTVVVEDVEVEVDVDVVVVVDDVVTPILSTHIWSMANSWVTLPGDSWVKRKKIQSS